MHDAVLHHFSENPGIRRFEPRVAPTSAIDEPLVWAVEPAKSYLYFFPRDCPRVTFFVANETSEADRRRFFADTEATRVVAIESAWLRRMQSTRLFRYELPMHTFKLQDAAAGYWVSKEAVEPMRVGVVDDLLGALARNGVEVRIMPSLRPLKEAVVASTLGFSIIRFRNPTPRGSGGNRD